MPKSTVSVRKPSTTSNWQKWANTAAAQSKGTTKKGQRKPKQRPALREPSGLCRWRHHSRCVLNSVPLLTSEMHQHVVALEFAIDRQQDDLRDVHVHRLDSMIEYLCLLRGRMASHAASNGSPVRPENICMSPSVVAAMVLRHAARQADVASEKGVTNV